MFYVYFQQWQWSDLWSAHPILVMSTDYYTDLRISVDPPRVNIDRLALFLTQKVSFDNMTSTVSSPWLWQNFNVTNC